MPILLATFYFFYFSIIGVYIIFLPKVLSLSGYSASEIGLILAASPLVRFIVPLFFIKGLTINQKSFNSALAILILSSISFYFSLDSFYKLLLSNIFFGIGLSLVLPYVELIALYYLAKERYGKIRLFGSVGFIVVALVLVRYLNDGSTVLLFLLTLSMVTALVAFIISQNATILETQSKDITNDIDLFKDWRLWAGFILMQVSFGSFYNFFTIFVTAHNISLDMTIYLWSFGVIVEIIMLYFQAPLLRHNLLKIIYSTTFITSIRWLLVYLFPSNIAVLFFTQTLHAFSFALFHSASISYLFHLYRHRSLAQQLFSGMAYGFGAFFGAVLSGYIYELFESYLFLSSFFVALIATYLLYSFEKNRA